MGARGLAISGAIVFFLPSLISPKSPVFAASTERFARNRTPVMHALLLRRSRGSTGSSTVTRTLLKGQLKGTATQGQAKTAKTRKSSRQKRVERNVSFERGKKKGARPKQKRGAGKKKCVHPWHSRAASKGPNVQKRSDSPTQESTLPSPLRKQKSGSREGRISPSFVSFRRSSRPSLLHSRPIMLLRRSSSLSRPSVTALRPLAPEFSVPLRVFLIFSLLFTVPLFFVFSSS